MSCKTYFCNMLYLKSIRVLIEGEGSSVVSLFLLYRDLGGVALLWSNRLTSPERCCRAWAGCRLVMCHWWIQIWKKDKKVNNNLFWFSRRRMLLVLQAWSTWMKKNQENLAIKNNVRVRFNFFQSLLVPHGLELFSSFLTDWNSVLCHLNRICFTRCQIH